MSFSVFVLKTNRLFTFPFEIVVESVVEDSETRGSKTPLSFDTTSNWEEALGVKVPIPT